MRISQLHSRRQMLAKAGCGFGMLGLAGLLQDEGLLGSARADSLGNRALNPLASRDGHFTAKAKHVIWLFINGGPSYVDTWDYKPSLEKWNGKSIREFEPEFKNTTGFFKNSVGNLMKSPFKFTPRGECGKPVSEIFPHLGEHVDKMAFIHSGFTESNNHSPALYAMNCGMPRMGFPSVGSWVTYGLGSESRNLPAYVVLADPQNRLPVNNVENWMSGYLPPLYQGTQIKSEGTPMLHIKPDYEEPAGITAAKRNLINALDRMHKAKRPNQPVLDSRIANYQMAARMQVQASEALDVSSETEATRALYGIGEKETNNFGKRCLMARRLVERGVRFVQIYPRGQMWDNHSNIKTSLPAACRQSDKPCAALLRDLRQRGLLDDVLVLWGGEFGRLPMAQGDYGKAGRDHGPSGFTNWLAGGGVKGGVVYGETDDIGYGAVKDRVSIQDWHATILHQLGMDHEKLTFDRNGLEERLTHTYPTRVVKEIL